MTDTTKPITDLDPATPTSDDQVLGIKGGVVRLFSVEQVRGDASLQLQEAKDYTDASVAAASAAANSFATGSDAATLASAQSYASTAASGAQAAAEATAAAGDTATLNAAKAYTDANAGGVSSAYVDSGDAATLAAAQSYADGLTPDPGSITLPMLSSIATASLLGRHTAGSGAPEVIAIGSGLQLSAGTLSSTGSGTPQSYVDTQDAATLSSAQAYTDTATGNNSITLAKMADIATNSLLGRVAGGTGDPQVLTIGAGLVVNGTSIEAPGTGSTVTQSGSGAVTRAVSAKALEIVSLTDFYNSGTDSGNYSPALERAMAAGHTSIYFPPGSYTFNTLVDVVNNVRLIGPSSVFSDDIGGAKITANAGFIRNNSTTRKRIQVYGLSVTGNGTAGTRAIQGPFGGFISDCRFQRFPVAIENASSFLSRYYRCAFDGASGQTGTIGISLADANGVRVDDCYFSAYYQTAVSTRDVTPLTGSDNGSAIIISNNNFNTSNSQFSNNSLLKLSGNIHGYGNYFEDFSATESGSIFLDIKVNGFGDFGLFWCNNEMYGSSTAKHAIYLNGTRSGTLPNPYGGVIAYNRCLGFNSTTRPAIAFGTNNNVDYLAIHDNLPDDGVTISNRGPRSMYRPMADMGWDTSVSASGATWVTLPISQDVRLDNASGVASNSYVIRKAGVYEIFAQVTQTGASAVLAVEAQIVNGSTTVAHGTASYAAGGYATITLLAKTYCDVGDPIILQTRNGGAAVEGKIVIEWKGDGHH